MVEDKGFEYKKLTVEDTGEIVVPAAELDEHQTPNYNFDYCALRGALLLLVFIGFDFWIIQLAVHFNELPVDSDSNSRLRLLAIGLYLCFDFVAVLLWCLFVYKLATGITYSARKLWTVVVVVQLLLTKSFLWYVTTSLEHSIYITADNNCTIIIQGVMSIFLIIVLIKGITYNEIDSSFDQKLSECCDGPEV